MRLQATLANPEGRLLPGMFANARVVMPPAAGRGERAGDRGRRARSTAIRCSSCAEDGKDADGKPKHKAVQTFVETGHVSTGGWRSRAASPAGDVVVASGQLKLQNGAPVTVTADGARAARDAAGAVRRP